MSTPLSSGPRAYPFIKLIWGSSDVVKAGWRLGLFGFYSHLPGYPRSGLVISVRGLLRWALALGLVGYLALAAAVTRWLARDPTNRIGFADVLTWPVRRDHFAELRGRGWLAHGKEAINAKRWAEGVFFLRRGLDAWPGDFDARLALARFYLLVGERPRALALLAEGPRIGPPPPDWTGLACALAAEGEDWTTALLLGERGLPWLSDPPRPAERERLLARQCAALIGLGRNAAALTLAEAGGETIPLLNLERARALLALGRPAEAAAFLARRRAAAPPADQVAIVKLQARAWREAGRFDAMDQALRDLRALRPTDPELAAFAVEQCVRADRYGSAALDDYLFRFGGQPVNLQCVVRPLAEIPAVALVRRVVGAAAERGYAPLPFGVPLAMALLREGDWSALADELAALAPSLKSADPELQRWFGWMKSLSGALGSQSVVGSESLVAVLQARPLALEAHRLTVTALRRAGRHEAARDVLLIARRSYAESPWLLAQQSEVARALAEAATAPSLTSASVPPSSPITPNWRAFFQSTDDALARRQWTDARQLLRAARVAQPAWLAAHEGEVSWRELQVAQGLHDAPGLRLALSVYLNGDLERAAAVLAWARELAAAGGRDDAVRLVQGVLERTPDHPLAKSLLAAWPPRPRAP